MFSYLPKTVFDIYNIKDDSKLEYIRYTNNNKINLLDYVQRYVNPFIILNKNNIDDKNNKNNKNDKNN